MPAGAAETGHRNGQESPKKENDEDATRIDGKNTLTTRAPMAGNHNRARTSARLSRNTKRNVSLRSSDRSNEQAIRLSLPTEQAQSVFLPRPGRINGSEKRVHKCEWGRHSEMREVHEWGGVGCEDGRHCDDEDRKTAGAWCQRDHERFYVK